MTLMVRKMKKEKYCVAFREEGDQDQEVLPDDWAAPAEVIRETVESRSGDLEVG